MATINTPIAPQGTNPGMAGQFANKARDAASAVGNKAEDATYAMGSCMQSVAGKMRELKDRRSQNKRRAR